MYNGIGLQTARGSGTNGFVQKNAAFIRQRKERVDYYREEEDSEKLEKRLRKEPNKELMEHQWKRKIEVQCVELSDKLEEQGYVCVSHDQLYYRV